MKIQCKVPILRAFGGIVHLYRVLVKRGLAALVGALLSVHEPHRPLEALVTELAVAVVVNNMANTLLVFGVLSK